MFCPQDPVSILQVSSINSWLWLDYDFTFTFDLLLLSPSYRVCLPDRKVYLVSLHAYNVGALVSLSHTDRYYLHSSPRLSTDLFTSSWTEKSLHLLRLILSVLSDLVYLFLQHFVGTGNRVYSIENKSRLDMKGSVWKSFKWKPSVLPQTVERAKS